MDSSSVESTSVRSTMRDEAHNVTYHVMASRPLTRTEVYDAIMRFQAQRKSKRRKSPLRDRTITISTIRGVIAEA